MNNNQILLLIIIGALICSIILMYPRLFKNIGKFVFNVIIGLLIVYGINTIGINSLGIPETFRVGVNPFTASFMGLLGLPGVAVLYIATIFL